MIGVVKIVGNGIVKAATSEIGKKFISGLATGAAVETGFQIVGAVADKIKSVAYKKTKGLSDDWSDTTLEAIG